jgi:hypothetical protein
MKNNFIKAALLSFLLLSEVTVFANPFPSFATTYWLTTIKTLKNNAVVKKSNCIVSNVVTIIVYKCQEPIVDNSKKKDLETASTSN